MPTRLRGMALLAVAAIAMTGGCARPEKTSREDTSAATGGIAAAPEPRDGVAQPEAAAGQASSTLPRESAGKPAAPVDLAFELDSKPAPNAVVGIDLALTPQAASPTLELSFAADPGLELVSGADTARFTSVEAGKTYHHRVSVMPVASSALHLHVIVKLDLDNAPSVRTFSIPISVGGESAARKTQGATVDSTGQPIDSMRAETVER